MSVKNVKVRFNLDKENNRKAYEYLQNAEVSQALTTADTEPDGI